MTKDDLITIVEHYVPKKQDRESVLSAVWDYSEALIAAKPIVKCSSCLAPNSIRNNKVEIDIGDEQGSVASVQFEYCEKCGWRGDVEWFD